MTERWFPGDFTTLKEAGAHLVALSPEKLSDVPFDAFDWIKENMDASYSWAWARQKTVFGRLDHHFYFVDLNHATMFKMMFG